MMGVSVVWLRGYGASLFLGTPFVMGFVSAFAFNRDAPRSVMATLGVAYLTLVVVAGLIALAALEGLVCLLMALPLALLLASLGAVLGRQIAFGGRPAAAVTSLLVALPVLTGFEARALRAPLREVATAVDIDAPPEVVWKNVIGIAELPPPGEWVFRLGIAYPVRARIRGAGVGAVRTCEFSTGPFVEPITEWDPPRRLAFDVRAATAIDAGVEPVSVRRRAAPGRWIAQRAGRVPVVAHPTGPNAARGQHLVPQQPLPPALLERLVRCAHPPNSSPRAGAREATLRDGGRGFVRAAHRRASLVPYVAPAAGCAEFTLRAVVLGTLLSVAFGMVNAYLGLEGRPHHLGVDPGRGAVDGGAARHPAPRHDPREQRRADHRVGRRLARRRRRLHRSRR